jgi:predicted Zn-dependent protease
MRKKLLLTTRRILRGWLILGLCLALGAGGAAPAAAGPFFGEVGVKDEIEMGRKFDEMARKQLPIVDDPEINEYVRGLVNKVAAHIPQQAYPITTAVVNNPSINAFAVPGGYVYVFTGLLLNFEHESQVVGVIGHELGHVTQHHVAQRMEKMQIVNIASMIGMLGGVFLGVSGGGGESSRNLSNAMLAGTQAGAVSAFLTYTQDNEREADHVGLSYMMDSGYRPGAMPEGFELIKRRTWNMGSRDAPPYLATHPALNERIGYLQERIKRLPKEVQARTDDDRAFVRIKTLIRARYSDPEVALAYYNDKKGRLDCLDHLGLGMALERARRKSQAKEHFEDALECGQNEELIQREAGRFLFENGEYDAAQPVLERAVAMNSRDTFAMFFLARLLASKKQYKSAIGYLQEVAKRHPNDAEVHFHLGRVLGESGDMFNAYKELTYAAVYQNDRTKAQFHLEKVKALAKDPGQKKDLEDLEKAFEKQFKPKGLGLF